MPAATEKSLRPSLRLHQPGCAQTNSSAAADCTILALATLAPLIPSIRRLGIYADDWSVFARFRAHSGSTIADYFRTFYSLPVTHSRPLMDLYEAVLFRCFGVHPFGYHLVNALVFYASAFLLYLSLRSVLRDRFVALTVPVVFLLLPNYSSARFVPFAFMIGMSLALFSLNLYAMLRATQASTFAWALVSGFATIASGLLYEVDLPLFFLSLLVVAEVWRREPPSERLPKRSIALLLIWNLGALFAVLIFKAITTTRYHGIANLRDFVIGAVGINFYKLGLRLPIVAVKVLLAYWNPAVVAVALLFGILFFWYLRRLQGDSNSQWTSQRKALELIAFGLLVFAFGVSLFFVSVGSMAFTATGVENRTAVAPSLGLAFIFPGLSIFLGTLVPARRRLIASTLIALLCVCELLATGTIATFWASAADRQRVVLTSIQRDIPVLPAHSVLLLDGVCPYIGPGIVFEGGGDMGGALQLLYHDATLRGDVVTPHLRVHLDGIETVIYGRSRYYPYGSNLKVYDFRRRKAWNLSDISAAREYFGPVGRAYSSCPEGNEGDGVAIF